MLLDLAGRGAALIHLILAILQSRQGVPTRQVIFGFHQSRHWSKRRLKQLFPDEVGGTKLPLRLGVQWINQQRDVIPSELLSRVRQ